MYRVAAMVVGCLGTLGTRGSPLRSVMGKPFLVVMAGWAASLASAARWRAALLLACAGRPRCRPRLAVCCLSPVVCLAAPSTERKHCYSLGKLGAKSRGRFTAHLLLAYGVGGGERASVLLASCRL